MNKHHRDMLLRAAWWLDEEYRLLAMQSEPAGTESYFQNVGMRAATAEYASLLREWANLEVEPNHRAVSMQQRLNYERKLRASEVSAQADGAAIADLTTALRAIRDGVLP